MESQVLHLSFFSPNLRQEKRYCIYLPPSYHYEKNRRYSSLYLLPGLMDYERTWCDKGLVNHHMDSLIQDGKIGEMIVVMPDKDQAALEFHMAKHFTGYLAYDLIGHIDHEFRTIPNRKHRGIEGLSLGASWALRLGLTFPELYSSVSSLSGGYSEEMYSNILEKKDYIKALGMRFRIAAGTDEPEFIQESRHFAEFLKGLGFYCEFSLDEGPHEWTLWSKQVYNSLQFHYYSFNG